MGEVRVSFKYKKMKREEHLKRTVRGFLLLFFSIKSNAKCSSTVCTAFNPLPEVGCLERLDPGRLWLIDRADVDRVDTVIFAQLSDCSSSQGRIVTPVITSPGAESMDPCDTPS